jgi:hypothetical protein
VNKNTINTTLYTSGIHVQHNADCIVGLYCDWVYNSNLTVRVYSHCVYTAKCIVGVYCDWVYNASSGCICIVGIYSDRVYNAKCVVGTRRILNSKPVELWVHNASYILGVSGNYDNSDTRVGLQNSVAPFSAL